MEKVNDEIPVKREVKQFKKTDPNMLGIVLMPPLALDRFDVPVVARVSLGAGFGTAAFTLNTEPWFPNTQTP